MPNESLIVKNIVNCQSLRIVEYLDFKKWRKSITRKNLIAQRRLLQKKFKKFYGVRSMIFVDSKKIYNNNEIFKYVKYAILKYVVMVL